MVKIETFRQRKTSLTPTLCQNKRLNCLGLGRYKGHLIRPFTLLKEKSSRNKTLRNSMGPFFSVNYSSHKLDL